MSTAQDSRRRSRTKIVATVGPACAERAQLAALVDAGVDVFRLNMAHGEPAVQQQHLDNIRSISDEIDEPIAVLADLAGPKIRLGAVPDDRMFCEMGAEFVLVSGDESQAPNELTSTYPPLVDELRVGDRVMLADGTVAMSVESKEPGRVRLRVVERGTIRSRQGINLPGVTLERADDQRHAIASTRFGPRRPASTSSA